MDANELDDLYGLPLDPEGQPVYFDDDGQPIHTDDDGRPLVGFDDDGDPIYLE